MFVFIDDSGDANLQVRPYYALSAVAFRIKAETDGIGDRIHELRKNWGKKDGFEFKFSKLDPDRQTEFFQRVRDSPLRYASCVLRKKAAMGKSWLQRTSVYERVMRDLVAVLGVYFKTVDDAQDKPLRVSVVADECTDPDYWKHLDAAFGKLHSKDGLRMAKKPKPGKSASWNLLQLADMVCGAARWDTPEYRKLLTQGCLDIRQLP